MNHEHSHEESHHHTHAIPHAHHHAGKNLKTAFFLNLGFTVVEFVGGLLTNSVAILSDAIHDLGDSFTLAFAWYMERISHRKRNERLTFGYKRFSLLGALVSSLVLLLGSFFILMEAVPRIFHPEEVDPQGMLLLALLGVAVNGIAVLRLKGGHKLNERAVMLHLLEDVLGWVAVLAVSITLLFVDLPILDPILSVAITIFVLSKIYPNLKASLKIFLQYTPDDIDVQYLKEELEKEDKVDEVHDLHLWSIDGVYTIFSAHVVVKENMSLQESEALKSELKESLHRLGVEHATLELEAEGSSCNSCDSP